MQQAQSFNYSGEKGGGVYDTKPIGTLYGTFFISLLCLVGINDRNDL